MRKATRMATGSGGKPDPWGQNVYRFEEDWPDWNRGTLTLAECRALHAKACEAFNIEACPVRQHEGRMMSYLNSLPGAYYISLRLDHKNPAVVLHETAHYITDRYHKRTQDHGPTFQAAYFWLLARSGIAPREVLAASARKHGLRWRECGPQ